ncbi:MAG: aminotransferase class I/II-fold pyridoxal phosphate-dependent enzyme [Proteobacteria bacterium]|nr:aminotransferase class I/II-fold pyridoxal phosphate-dependent enzyme [Pseudomonadota bacterium]MBU1611891.1 aminotransferase class I/II-fold pyridoxal phosphate-dependent enzyme [Pseudomonadota bacterium]
MGYRFVNDYAEGAHPRVLELLASGGKMQEPGYGYDSLTARAVELIRRETASPDAAVHLVSGGTQANLTVLASMLRPHQSVIAAHSAHIAVHETGAIEATGHKIHSCVSPDGKLSVDAIMEVLAEHIDEHMVQPSVVFVSQSTEVGTIYSKAELTTISECCRDKGLYLYLDGARLGSALTCPTADMTLAELSALTDVFYVGGTKNGALLGEAIVINKPALKENFRFHLKQRGALIAKGRLLGAQFVALFEDGLYFELAAHANAMAGRLATGLTTQGIPLLVPQATNQVFPILSNQRIAELESDWGFMVWARAGEEHSAIRLVTSWCTPVDAVDAFLDALR